MSTVADNFPTQSHSSAGGARVCAFERVRVLVAVFFVVALFVPLIGTVCHWDPVASSENRVLAKAPEMPRNFKEVKKFADRFLGYYRDHFGFRNALIRGLSLAKFHGGLAVDQGTNIIIGKDGWLFFPSEAGDPGADRNLDPFTSADLDAWERMLEERERFCQSHGIKFIAVIPPDKQTIYRELVPDQFSLLGPKSRLDQLIERLREKHSPVVLVDLRAALREAKQHQRVYFKTDTHWNDYGAYAAYPVILDAINKVLPNAHFVPQPMSDFVPHSSKRSGDLARYMNLYYEYNEDWLQLSRKVPYPPIVDPNDSYKPITTTGTDPHAPSLYMIHDSYTLYLSQFLGPHFSRVCWQWTTVMDGPLILAFKPDIVIDEFLERTMYLTVPDDTTDVRAAETTLGQDNPLP